MSDEVQKTVLVYSGTHMECVSMRGTLCACGIWAIVEASQQRDDEPARVHVSQQNLERAIGIVEAMKRLWEKEKVKT
jgi:cytidine deaminase